MWPWEHLAVGNLAHLPADVLYLYVTNGYLTPEILLAGGRLLWLFVFEVALLVAGLAVWLHDGRTGREQRPRKSHIQTE